MASKKKEVEAFVYVVTIKVFLPEVRSKDTIIHDPAMEVLLLAFDACPGGAAILKAMESAAMLQGHARAAEFAQAIQWGLTTYGVPVFPTHSGIEVYNVGAQWGVSGIDKASQKATVLDMGGINISRRKVHSTV